MDGSVGGEEVAHLEGLAQVVVLGVELEVREVEGRQVWEDDPSHLSVSYF